MKKVIDMSDIKLFFKIYQNPKLALWIAIIQKLLKIQKIAKIYIMTGMFFHNFFTMQKINIKGEITILENIYFYFFFVNNGL